MTISVTVSGMQNSNMPCSLPSCPRANVTIAKVETGFSGALQVAGTQPMARNVSGGRN